MFLMSSFPSLAATALSLAGLVAAALPATTLPADAQTALSPEEFEAHVEGRTLTFATGGQVYGIEQFRPGRRVTWAFLGEECREGQWFAAPGEQICFAYEDDPRTHCWRFWLTDNGLRGRFTSAPGGTDEQDPEGGSEIVEVERSTRPLFCPGPQVGV